MTDNGTRDNQLIIFPGFDPESRVDTELGVDPESGVDTEPDFETRLGVVAILPDQEAAWEDEYSGWVLIPIAYSYDSSAHSHAIEVVRTEIDPSKRPALNELIDNEDGDYAWHLARSMDGHVRLAEYESFHEVAVGVIEKLERLYLGTTMPPGLRFKVALRIFRGFAIQGGVSRRNIRTAIRTVINERIGRAG
jgi:hypothetical protein